MDKEIENKVELILKLIRGKNYISLITNTVNIIHSIDRKDNIGVNFWNLITLYRWIIEYSTNTLILPNADANYVLALYRKVNELEDLYNKAFFDAKGLDLDYIMQLIGNQQSVYQESTGVIVFARQFVLYNHSEKINSLFSQAFGMNINEWLKELFLGFFCISYNFDNQESEKNLLGINYNYIVSKYGDKKNSDLLLSKLSMHLMNLTQSRESVKKSTKVNSKLLRMYDQHSLSVYPFYNLNNKHFLLHRKLLTVNMNYGIYDLLKSNYGRKFTDEFSGVFENYIKLGLDEIEENYDFDQQRVGQKTADFVIHKGVVIECKAIESPMLYSVNPSQENVSRYLKKDIIKAFKQQIFNEAKTLKEVDTNKRIFGVLITYKETNLSFGNKLFDRLFGKESKEAFEEFISKDDLFTLSISEWDLLINQCKTEKIKLHQILSEISDREKIKSRHYVSMDLKENYNCRAVDLSYLKEARENFQLQKE